ncbi:hypothetical protein N7510_001880 [Penicillium lagena]|uniref:uncharacterized protein n=1 Tax=Penicillium lagena TaxID=94218 RepID=UPI00253FC051|nr:uncharacterized protein N7510_001880 [Penicillium lagena]KAJ5625571.1 hypothetical protein N7510_001880 [Penicillium lagena]
MANCGKVPDDPRSHLYVYMLRTASLAKPWGIAGDDSAAAPFRVARRIHQHGVPSTYVLHGEADTAVGVEQSDEVADAILGCGLTVEYERPHWEDHLLDQGEGY